MATHLYVAAGGGGDALAALMVHHSLGRGAEPAAVMSYSWDRYIMDPQPGPRTRADFTSLRRAAEGCWEISATSRLQWPASPTLPLVARATDARVVLLDPCHGATAMRRAILEFAASIDASEITLVDVGGDVIASGHEPDLLSPLADALALAALADTGRPVSVVVAGPGLDGELSPGYVRTRCGHMTTRTEVITADAVAAHRTVLREHPSEATSLLAACALGIQGQVEVRDRGTLVPLSEAGAMAYVVPQELAMESNRLAIRLVDTTSLDEAEGITLDECGRCELAYERRKAAAADPTAHDPADRVLEQRLEAYRRIATARGASHATFRRASEVIGIPVYDPERLRRLVTGAHSYLPLYRL